MLGLRHDPHDLSLDEEVSLVAPRSDSEVRLSCFSGTVHDTPHHRHLKREVPVLERLLDRLRHADHVDLCPSARRACDQVEALSLPQTQSLEKLAARPRLFDRVGGQRVPDRVSDPFGEKGRDPGGPLQQTRRGGPASVTPR